MKHTVGRANIVARLLLTLTVATVTVGSALIGSATADAIEYIDQTDNALTELSQHIAAGHASLRARIVARGAALNDALAQFDAAFERRVSRLRSLNAGIERSGAALWTEPLEGAADVRRLEEQRNAYLAAVASAGAAPARDAGHRLRLFDLHAQQLIQTLEAARDSADTARRRALFAAEGMSTMSAGLWLLVIAYLIWYPVFVRGHRATPTRAV